MIANELLKTQLKCIELEKELKIKTRALEILAEDFCHSTIKCIYPKECEESGNTRACINKSIESAKEQI